MVIASLQHACETAAAGTFSLYKGNESGEVPGLLPGSGTVDGYYW